MRLFLRYQVSGMIFIIWCIIFYHGDKASDFNELFNYIICRIENIKDVKLLVTLGSILVAVAFPIGALIHQLSVIIKNWVLPIFFGDEFNDHPRWIPENLDYSKDSIKYFLNHISKLNSFYYVRFDAGVLAPLLAFFFIQWILEISIHHYWWISAMIVGTVTISYVFRIHDEIKFYRGECKTSKDPKNQFTERLGIFPVYWNKIKKIYFIEPKAPKDAFKSSEW